MTHLDIINKAGGVAAVHRALGLPRERVAAWKRQNSIPGRYWAAIDAAGLASVADLARAAPSPTTHEAA